MPELPEVEALATFLRDKAVGRTFTRVDVVAINALKTFQPPITALVGRTFAAVSRHGKFLDITTTAEGEPDLHFVIHLARAGWLRWVENMSDTPPRPGKGPLALRVHLGDGIGFNLTEAGTQKRLAAYVVQQPSDVPGVARLGPDPLGDDFTLDRFRQILTVAKRAQLKGVLTEQERIAGIGNAYSDEILHTAKLSPFKPASGLTDDELERLYAAIRSELTEAAKRSAGLAAKELKSDKKTNMAVHGRTGQPCPVCGDTVREVSFADKSLQYCATCQTGGKPLADRRLSKLLK
jgi:formamidopyrimidine-DNA glycosylase